MVWISRGNVLIYKDLCYIVHTYLLTRFGARACECELYSFTPLSLTRIGSNLTHLGRRNIILKVLKLLNWIPWKIKLKLHEDITVKFLNTGWENDRLNTPSCLKGDEGIQISIILGTEWMPTKCKCCLSINSEDPFQLSYLFMKLYIVEHESAIVR